MIPMRIPGISSPSRVTVFLRLRLTWVRHGYMLPVVSNEKTTSTRSLLMGVPPGGRRIIAQPQRDATLEVQPWRQRDRHGPYNRSAWRDRLRHPRAVLEGRGGNG